MKDWKEVSRKRVFDKKRFQVDEIVFELPNGKQNNYLIRNTGSVAKIFAVTKEKEIVMIQQFRPGPGEIVHELPGGFCDKNEDPKESAERELLEETGYKGNMQLLTTFWLDAYSNMKIYAFFATECYLESNQNLDHDEFIDVELLSIDRLNNMFSEGKMRDIGICSLGLKKMQE